MLDFRHLRNGLVGADSLRRYRERTGITGGGKKLWSERETRILERLYPDYRAAMKALPGRTYSAIKYRARDIGLVRRRHIWTGAELVRLRRLAFHGASIHELMANFPGLRARQIIGALYHHRIKRRRHPFRLTGHPLLDAVRERCYRTGVSMCDLDAYAGTRCYFKNQSWRTADRVDVGRVARAAEAIHGTLSVTWPD